MGRREVDHAVASHAILRSAILALIVSGFSIQGTPVAYAECGASASHTSASTAPGTVVVAAEAAVSSSCTSITASGQATVEVRDSDLDAACVRNALSNGLGPFEECDLPAEPTVEAPQVTPGMVAAALRRLPLPASQLQVQPPNGRTLVNFATNFYTERGDLTRSVTLLGRTVDLRITASSYTWHFGDGSTATTSEPGAPYPALDVTHDYRKAGRVTPSVDTTYTAEFSVDGGPWRPVDGTVTIPGAPVGLRVLTATPTLVGYR
jgi:hypothetical protein